MQTLRAAMKSLGYLHLDMANLKLPAGLLPKELKGQEIRNARVFTKEGRGDVSPQEARQVNRELNAFKTRQAAKSKTASYHPHPRQDPRTPRTWVVLME